MRYQTLSSVVELSWEKENSDAPVLAVGAVNWGITSVQTGKAYTAGTDVTAVPLNDKALNPAISVPAAG